MRPGTARELAWILVPFAVFVAVLASLWFDAPVWDDYDTVLAWLMKAQDAPTVRDWLGLLFELHNEHRIVVTRLLVLGVAAIGEVDFRALMLLGNLSLLGIALFQWAEFRDRVPAAALGAAAIVIFQWSHWEASLMATAAPPHLGAVFFSLGCIAFALRAGPAGATLAALFGLLAAGSQANGLLALPIAAVACVLFGSRRRAAGLAVLAAIAWILYFRGFVRPPWHPSPVDALGSPWATFKLFLVNVGAIMPDTRLALVAGALMLGGLAWIAVRGYWKAHPVAGAWIVFLLSSAGAAAAARVGFGIVWQSRYAVISACILAILGLAAFAVARPRTRWVPVSAVVGAIAVSLGVSRIAWPDVANRSVTGNLLRETAAADATITVPRFAGAHYPDEARANRFLEGAGDRRLYSPRKVVVQPWKVVAATPADRAARSFGHVDTVAVSRQRVTVTGWTGIPATSSGRTLRVVAPSSFAVSGVALVPRKDVAFHFRDPDLLLAGFRVDLDFASEEEAQRAAGALCVLVEAPGHPAAMLQRAAATCG